MEDYSAKLTGEPFLFNETKILAEYFADGLSISELKNMNIEKNLIKHKTVGSIKRVNSPIFRRLSIMSNDMLKSFLEDDLDNSKFLLLYTIMKTDKLVRDFIFEIYKDKILIRKDYIEKYEINNWYEEKCIISNYLNERSESTSYKLKQVLMKILVDAGLVQKEKDKFKIIRPLLREKFITMLEMNGDIEYAKAIGGLH